MSAVRIQGHGAGVQVDVLPFVGVSEFGPGERGETVGALRRFLRLFSLKHPFLPGKDRPKPNAGLVQAAGARIEALRPTVDRVGAMLVGLQAEDLGIRTKSNHMDLVTKADVASEEALLEFIRTTFPADEILAEESGGDLAAARDAEFAWAVDPVDGTINYAHGLPLYAISLGLLHHGEPVAGLVALPALGAVYSAVLGQGAFCDGHPIRVSPEHELSRGLVVTGFPYNRAEIMPVLLAGVEAILSGARGMRRTGSAALDLCWLAQGRFAALYELNLNAWDSVAGVALVREAGGHVTNLFGDRYDPFAKSVVASNGVLHEALLACLDPVQKRSLELGLPL